MKDRHWLVISLAASVLVHLAMTLIMSVSGHQVQPGPALEKVSVLIVKEQVNPRKPLSTTRSSSQDDAVAVAGSEHADARLSKEAPDEQNIAPDRAAASTSASSPSSLMPDSPASSPPMSEPIAAPTAPLAETTAVADRPTESWERQVHEKLLALKRYPAPARYASLEDVIVLTIRIARNGQVRACTIQRSKGIAALDAAALDLIRRASPLPPPPSVSDSEIDLTVPVVYSLRRDPPG